jgi:hypothetical protein
MSNYKTIEYRKLILSKFEFKPSMQGGFYSNEFEVCKYDFEAVTNEQQKIVFSNILKQLDCKPENKILNKIIKDIAQNEYTIFKQSKQGLKTELLKTFSLKIEKTTTKQYQLTI